MNANLSDYVQAVKDLLKAKQIQIVEEKSINYGWQLSCSDGTNQAKVNLYSGKKGLSKVIQGRDSALKALLETQLTGQGSVAATQSGPIRRNITLADADIALPKDTPAWMGCDESGKGDVFGPLVCAACTVTAAEAVTLRRAGVCDSKKLTDPKIVKLAQVILQTVGERCIIRTVMPPEYNQLYEQCRNDHKNLNDLLGALHGQNIQSLLSKYECPCIIVDKFGNERYVLAGLGGLEKTHRIIQVPRGERDIAVAAASVLARYGFINGVAAMSKQYGIAFPKGAYQGIPETIRTMLDRFGASELSHVGKMNFTNFDFVR